MNPLFAVGGAVLGLIFAPTMIPGAVWCVQTTLNSGWRGGTAAAAALAAAQALWAAVAATVLFLASGPVRYTDLPLRILAVLVLGYMALSVIRARRLDSLASATPVQAPARILRRTFVLACLMPMRFAGYAALLVAVSLHLHRHGAANAVFIGIGVGAGSLAWWLFFVLLAYRYGRSVPEAISVRSLNKLRVLAVAVFCGLMALALAPVLASV